MDTVNVFNTPIETLKMGIIPLPNNELGNLDSMRTAMRTLKAEVNEPLYKLIPNLIFLFKLNGKVVIFFSDAER